MAPSKLRIYHKLQIAAHRVQKAADRAVFAAARVSTAQAAVISIVAAQGPITQRAVARQLGLNESGMTAMTSRLLSMGLLERLRDETDVRAWLLRLTAKGRAALKLIEPPFRGVNQTIERTLDERELALLAEYLSRIANAFETER
jgi:DNA-binding MarR family transcriptional regulator